MTKQILFKGSKSTLIEHYQEILSFKGKPLENEDKKQVVVGWSVGGGFIHRDKERAKRVFLSQNPDFIFPDEIKQED